MQQFQKSLNVVYESVKQNEIKPSQLELESKRQQDDEYNKKSKPLIDKIQGILRSKDLNVWDAITSCSLNLTPQEEISKTEFKVLLKSLDLGLNLNEKIQLCNLLDPKKTNLIKIQEFINKFNDEDQIHKVTRKIIEKVSLALFYKTYKIEDAFKLFDVNGDKQLSKYEFTYGIGLLDLGVTSIECRWMYELIDKDKSGSISEQEFKDVMLEVQKTHGIDPLKEFAMNLMNKVKDLIKEKNNMLTSFLKFDLQQTGFIDVDQLKNVFIDFGLDQIEDHQFNTLMQIYQKDEEGVLFKQNLAKKKIDYKHFIKKLNTEIDSNLFDELTRANQMLKQLKVQFSQKKFSLFDAFMNFDINQRLKITKLEFKLGLQQLKMDLQENDLNIVWSSFAKDKRQQVNFYNFQKRFIEAGCEQLLAIDTNNESILRKFSQVVRKLGPHEEAFRKLDIIQQQGQISLIDLQKQNETLALGFSTQHVEIIFNQLSYDCVNEKEKYINFKMYVNFMSKYTSKEQIFQSYYQLHQGVTKKRLSWKNIIQDYKFKSDPKVKPHELLLKDLKNLVSSLKLGISQNDLTLMTNAFNTQVITFNQIESMCQESAGYQEKSKSEQLILIKRLQDEINQKIQKENLNVDRLFFEFDKKQEALLEFFEFAYMIEFLKINANKNQIRTLFDIIDINKKNEVTLQQFKSFLTQYFDDKQGQKNLKKHKGDIENVIKNIIEQKSKTSISTALKQLEITEQNSLTLKNLDSILTKVDVVLQKADLQILYEEIVRQIQGKEPQCQNLIEFAIREGIDSIQVFQGKIKVPPSVILNIEKLNIVMQRLALTPEILISVMKKTHSDNIERNDFIQQIQSFGIDFTQEDLIQFCKYFDQEEMGQISVSNFIQRFCLYAGQSLAKVEGTDNKSSRALIKQEVHLFSKNQGDLDYQKKFTYNQMISIFDVSGDGAISESEFVEALKIIGINIELSKIRVIMIYLGQNLNDVEGSNQIQVEDLVRSLIESTPNLATKKDKLNQSFELIDKIQTLLKGNKNEFLTKLLEKEKFVVAEENYDGIKKKNQSGVHIQDFFQMLQNMSIYLEQQEKQIIVDIFQMAMNKEYLDIEQIYNLYEEILEQKNESFNQKDQDLQNQNNQWMRTIFREIGEYFKSLNLTIEQAFRKIDQEMSYISQEKFINFLKNLHLKKNLSEREINMILDDIQIQGQPYITFQQFQNKFITAYSDFEQDKKQIQKQLNSIQFSVQQNIEHLLNLLKQKCNNQIEKCWVMIDDSKEGRCSAEDFKNGLLKMGIYVSKQEIASCFKFINQQSLSIGYISFWDLLEFWSYDSVVQRQQLETVNKVLLLEEQILKHLCCILNQMEISLWQCFKDFDQESKGYLDLREFRQLLKQIDINLEDQMIMKLMQLMQEKTGDKLYYTDLEARLLKFGLVVKMKSEQVIVEWNDKIFNRVINQVNKQIQIGEQIQNYFEKFDSDYDSILSLDEFHCAIKKANPNISTKDIQRIMHIIVSSKVGYDQTKIPIQQLVQIFNKRSLMMVNNNGNELYINYQVFKNLLQNFDGFENLFRISHEIKTNNNMALSNLKSNKKQLRSFILYSRQLKTQELSNRFQSLIKDTQQIIQMIKQHSIKYINNIQASSLIQSDSKNSILLDGLTIQKMQQILDQINLPQMFDQNFVMDMSSQENYNDFIVISKAQFNNKSVDVIYLSKDACMRSSKDGLSNGKHIDNEMRLHFKIQNETDNIFKLLSKYEKKVGLESIDKDLFILYEQIDLNKWISLKDLINQNGGLIRIPFLTKVNSISYIIKFWGKKIIDIIDIVQQSGYCLTILRPENLFVSNDGQHIKLKTVRGSGQLNSNGYVSQLPDIINNIKSKDLIDDPYLAPEILYKRYSQVTRNCDSWSFGIIMYEILFGHPPEAYFKQIQKQYPNFDLKIFEEPSPFYCYDIYSDEIIKSILKFDYNTKIDPNDKTASVQAIEKCDFGGAFKLIFENDQSMNNILNIIQLCLEFDPIKRPTIGSLSSSPIFKQDKFESLNSQSFSKNMFFYKSPSMSLKDTAFIPLRELCAISIADPQQTLNYFDQLIKVIDVIQNGVIDKTNRSLEMLKQSLNLKNDSQLDQINIPTEMQQDMAKGNHARLKLPNYYLVKFVFDNNMIDLIVFLVLRYHKNSNDLSVRQDESERLLRATKNLFQTMIFDLQEYNTAFSPFVSMILENFVKFFIGEEYMLGSSQISKLHEQYQLKFHSFDNKFQEYKKNKRLSNERFFARNQDSFNPDQADVLWKKHSLKKSHIFTSLNWSPLLYNIVGSLYKESITESGVGKTNYKVLQDYLQYSQEIQIVSEYNINQKIQRLNQKLSGNYPKTIDYYNGMIAISECLITLQSKQSGKSSLKIIMDQIKSLLQSKTTDKIKIVLDSKLPQYLLTFLYHEDVHIRGGCLEIFYEISKGFELLNQPFKKSSGEVNKIYGLVSHLNTFCTDKLDQKKFTECVNDYFQLNTLVNLKYLQQVALVFENPAIVSPLFNPLKQQSELISNKTIVLKIFNNIVLGPKTVINNLRNATMDVFFSVFKLLLNKQTADNQLRPLILDIYNNLATYARSEIIDMIDQTQGFKSIVRENNLQIPMKLNVKLLFDRAQKIKRFYAEERNQIQQEIKGEILSRKIKMDQKQSQQTIKDLYHKLKQLGDNLLSFYNFYYPNQKLMIESRKLINEYIDFQRLIFQDLFMYAQLNIWCSTILDSFAEFCDQICKLGLVYMLFNEGESNRALHNVQWMINIIKKINDYHAFIKEDQTVEKQKDEKNEKEILGEDDFDLRSSRLLNHLIDHESLRKYSTNKLNALSHKYQRVLMCLLESGSAFALKTLNDANFGTFFSTFTKKQYTLLLLFIKTKTEDIHILNSYVEESNIRLRTFELIIKSGDNQLIDSLIESGFIINLTGPCMKNMNEFDVSISKSDIKFLPFRNFLPLRNEALAMMTSIVWNKEKSPKIYKEMLIGHSRYDNIRKELEIISQQSKGIKFISSLYFFTLIEYTQDKQLLFLMNHSRVYEQLQQVFKINVQLKNQFPILQSKLQSQGF